MTSRRLIAAVVALVLAVAATQLIVWWLKPAQPSRPLVGPPRSGYTLKHFTLYMYGDDGQLSFRIHAPSLQRRDSDQSLYIDAPHFLLPAKDSTTAPPWHGHSAYGWVNAGATLIRLMGPVTLKRPAFDDTPAASIHTSDVTAWPHDQRLATDRPAQLRQGQSRMSGIGLRANLDTKHLELLHDFHGTFAPGVAH